jgi:hypothetical protein
MMALDPQRVVRAGRGSPRCAAGRADRSRNPASDGPVLVEVDPHGAIVTVAQQRLNSVNAIELSGGD